MLRSVATLLTLCLAQPSFADCVVLLHGLARTSNSMNQMAEAFRQADFKVANINYPSRKLPVQELAPLAIDEGMEECADQQRVHFVTHSLGGILVRYYLKEKEIPELGRVVMLAPPNQGSQVADELRDNFFYKLLNGPAGNQLGTESDSLVNQLGPVDFPLGVIAGTRTVNPLLSQLLPNPDDGKVTVENTKVDGMADFIQVPHSHTFMMQADNVIEQSLNFILRGSFADLSED